MFLPQKNHRWQHSSSLQQQHQQQQSRSSSHGRGSRSLYDHHRRRNLRQRWQKEAIINQGVAIPALYIYGDHNLCFMFYFYFYIIYFFKPKKETKNINCTDRYTHLWVLDESTIFVISPNISNRGPLCGGCLICALISPSFDQTKQMRC